MNYQFTVNIEIPEKYYLDLLVIKENLSRNPSASVILSRTLLQQIIRDEISKAGVGAVNEVKATVKNKRPSLWRETEYFFKNLEVIPFALQDQLQDNLEVIREFGNMAVHPEYVSEESEESELSEVSEKNEITLAEAETIIALLENFLSFIYLKKPFKSDKSDQMSRIAKNRRK